MIRPVKGTPPAAGEPFMLKVSRAAVRVAVLGSGPRTMVVVPDPPNLIEHHREVLARLAGERRIITFELPGFGLSKLGRGERFGIDLMVEVMEEALERLSVRDATLEMACLGAMVGLRLASRRPDLVARLVLAQVSTVEQMQAWARGTDILGLIHTPVVGQALVSLARYRIARHWYRVALPEGTDAETYRRYLDPTIDSFRRSATFDLASAYQSLRRLELDYATVTQPVLLLFGKADRTHAATDPRPLQRALPRAELVELDGCGHFPTLEHPDRYLGLLGGWEASR